MIDNGFSGSLQVSFERCYASAMHKSDASSDPCRVISLAMENANIVVSLDSPQAPLFSPRFGSGKGKKPTRQTERTLKRR